MVVSLIKRYTFIYLLISISILICMFFSIRFRVLHPGNDFNTVMLTEVIFVLLMSFLILQYLIRRRKENSCIKIQKDSGTEQFLVQFCRMDHTEDVIHMTMKDLLILGRDINITHIAFPKEEAISSQHCRLIYENDVMYLEDLASTNGTYYNGRRIYHQTAIESGCEIMLANIPFKVSWKLIQRH